MTRLTRLSLLLAVITLLCLPLKQATAQTPLNPTFGLVNAYGDPEAAAASGAGWELLTLRWDQLQPEGPDQWEPDSDIDDWLATARSQNREVVAILIGTPEWAADGDPNTGPPAGLFLPIAEGGNTWAGFVRQAVNYYGSRGINRWVIWADQDIPASSVGATWTGSVAEYYQLVKVAYQVAKDANPNALVHLGGASYTDPGWFGRFMDQVVDDPTAAANNYYFDIATIHVFGSPSDVYTRTGNHYGIMAQSGIPSKPVWINQTNARPTDDPLYPADATFSRFPNVTQEQQAAFIVQAYALGFAAGAERIAVYQLVDDLPQDDDEAFGLVRADGTAREAYLSYQLAAELMNGSVFERRVDEETFPLIDYVRFTFESRVMHVMWARTEEDATLSIPARSESATVINLNGTEWRIEPASGAYEISVAGAVCNDPVYTCLIGGAPWILIEDGIEGALEQVAPPVTVEPGGTVLDPADAVTAEPPTEPAPPTGEAVEETPTAEATDPPATTEPEPTEAAEVPASEQPDESAATQPPPENTDPDLTDIEAGLQPQGFEAALPYVLGAVGALVIVGGAWYFAMGQLPGTLSQQSTAADEDSPDEDHAAPTEEHSAPEVEDEHTAPTVSTERPDLPDDEELNSE